MMFSVLLCVNSVAPPNLTHHHTPHYPLPTPQFHHPVQWAAS